MNECERRENDINIGDIKIHLNDCDRRENEVEMISSQLV